MVGELQQISALERSAGVNIPYNNIMIVGDEEGLECGAGGLVGFDELGVAADAGG